MSMSMLSQYSFFWKPSRHFVFKTQILTNSFSYITHTHTFRCISAAFSSSILNIVSEIEDLPIAKFARSPYSIKAMYWTWLNFIGTCVCCVRKWVNGSLFCIGKLEWTHVHYESYNLFLAAGKVRLRGDKRSWCFI